MLQEGSRTPSHPSSSAGSQASAKLPLRALRQVAARRGKAPAPTERAQKEAAARARNARNQQLHRQRQKVRSTFHGGLQCIFHCLPAFRVRH